MSGTWPADGPCLCGRPYGARMTETGRKACPHPAETFREVPPASPLAALNGAVGRLEATTRRREVRACSHGVPAIESCGKCAAQGITEFDRAHMCYVLPGPAATPAEMLGEAMEHIRRARALIAGATSAHDIVAERADDDLEEASQRVEGLKREAEAKHGR